MDVKERLIEREVRAQGLAEGRSRGRSAHAGHDQPVSGLSWQAVQERANE
jgi:hypothetical protein